MYALALKDDNTIQGLVGIKNDKDPHAEYLGMLHQYQFFIDEEQAKKLLEVYHYEWNET